MQLIESIDKYRQATDLFITTALGLTATDLDAPYPDEIEIAIAIAAVSGPRPHARIGDLTTDPQKL